MKFKRKYNLNSKKTKIHNNKFIVSSYKLPTFFPSMPQKNHAGFKHLIFYYTNHNEKQNGIRNHKSVFYFLKIEIQDYLLLFPEFVNIFTNTYPKVTEILSSTGCFNKKSGSYTRSTVYNPKFQIKTTLKQPLRLYQYSNTTSSP